MPSIGSGSENVRRPDAGPLSIWEPEPMLGIRALFRRKIGREIGRKLGRKLGRQTGWKIGPENCPENLAGKFGYGWPWPDMAGQV